MNDPWAIAWSSSPPRKAEDRERDLALAINF